MTYTQKSSHYEKHIDNILTLFITINDSVYHSFQGKIFDHQVFEPKALYSSDSDELVRCVIFGQTCDSIDIIVEDIMLPYPKLNDILLFQHMGAYSLASAEGRFNGFLCAEIDYQP